MSRKVNTKDFVKKAITIHGTKYNYSKVNYINCSTKVIIICHEHGEFKQTSSNHNAGSGCPKCSDDRSSKRKLSSAPEFIKKVSKIHKNKYDYSKVNYVNSKTKVIIICHDHGEFMTTPKNHIKTGCPKCAVARSARHNSSNIDDFIRRANVIHKNKYDYYLTEYKHCNIKVTIVCSEHGEFVQMPSNHLLGHGCYQCGIVKMKKSNSSNLNDFIEKAKLIHKNKYSYYNAEYISAKDRITITCFKHGNFSQLSNNHLIGHGCPICNSSKGELKIIEALNKLNVTYVAQKTFPKCADKHKLRFDFYIPSHNLCIEYDGIQHYQGWWRNPEQSLSEIQKKDLIKTLFCENNMIELLRIPYFEFDRINEIITKRLSF